MSLWLAIKVMQEAEVECLANLTKKLLVLLTRTHCESLLCMYPPTDSAGGGLH